MEAVEAHGGDVDPPTTAALRTSCCVGGASKHLEAGGVLLSSADDPSGQKMTWFWDQFRPLQTSLDHFRPVWCDWCGAVRGGIPMVRGLGEGASLGGVSLGGFMVYL